METGAYGEAKAEKYLKKIGYKIIDRNVLYKWGEIDIVAKDRSGTLVFIEVKTFDKQGQNKTTNKDDLFRLRPEDNLTASKLKKLIKSALFFANENGGLINDNKGWRIDLLSLTIYEKDCVIKHFENIG